MPKLVVARLAAICFAVLAGAGGGSVWAAEGAGLPPAAEGAGLPPGAKPVPMEIRDLVEDAISKNLPLPETAEWHFDFMQPYAGGGDVVCGRVNFQSLQRKYVGINNFYAVIKRQAVTLAVLQDPPWLDSSGQEALKFKLLCNRA